MTENSAKTLITDMHSFFADWFSGTVERSTPADFEVLLDPEFTMINPDGSQSTRQKVIDDLNNGYGQAPGLVVGTEDWVVIASTPDLEVGRYVEVQRWETGANKRLTTAVFVRRAGSPRGLVMRHAQETWLETPTTQDA